MKTPQSNNVQVLLVNMPFGPLMSPSIGLSLLKGSLKKRGINTILKYYSIKFAQLIGAKTYSAISNGAPINHDLAGEWIFSGALFDQSNAEVEEYIHEVMMGNNLNHSKEKYGVKKPSERFIEEVLSVRAKVKPFLDECVAEIVKINPKVVGFTSVFQQQLASLALAKRVKKALPNTVIILGGANNEGKMGIEYVKKFSFIDAVFSGEGDFTFPEVVEEIMANNPFHHIKGVVSRQNLHQIEHSPNKANAPLVRNMDALPLVDYDDYFEQFEAANFETSTKPRLLFETSRGCWWGEISHCTFCGLNGHNMAHRSKSADRALQELNHLSDRYPGHAISVVDNILDMKYFKDLIPSLAEQNNPDLELFYEVKSNLTKIQITNLKHAGITTIQPGIESLSNQVLKIMKKGVSFIQNIQLLKWCKEIGVHPEWNMLWGFPGEDPEEYQKMTELIPLIMHLPPSGSAGPIRLDRFSPNFNSSTELGFKNVRPYPTYQYIFPFEKEALHNLAYYFTFEYQKPTNVDAYTQSFREQIDFWKEQYPTSDLFYVNKQTALLIWDFRPIAKKTLTLLTGAARFFYLSCDKIKTVRQLQEEYAEVTQKEISATEIKAILDKLVTDFLCIQHNNHYLSLALPLGVYSPNNAVLKILNEHIKSMGEYNEKEGRTVIKV